MNGALFSRPGPSQGLLSKHSRHSFIERLILFLPQLYCVPTPKRFEIELPVIKYTGLGHFSFLIGYGNCIIGSKVTAILLIGLFGLLVELHGEGSAHSLTSRLVSIVKRP